MLQLLRLLLYLAAGAVILDVPGAQSTYFESAPSCGHAATGFVHFDQSPELLTEKERFLGVCGWGFGEGALRPQVKSCIACSFTPADQPRCAKGSTLVPSPVWYLAPQEECRWQGCWQGGGACSNGTVESTARCEDGTPNLKCCPFRPYVRCCSSVLCTYRTSPVGQCVVAGMDLLPGQQLNGPLFAVPTASTDCAQYSWSSPRVCRSDRTFAPEPAYESCETRAVSRDSEGCAKLPGYTFHQGLRISDSDNWRTDDGTQWNKLPNAAAAQQAAAGDMLLMAARCSALDACAGFQNTGASTDLLYQLPMTNKWVPVNRSTDARCHGIYEKTPPQTGCPRISGYLFMPLRTLDMAAASGFTAPGGAGPCSSCANGSALASRCDADSACAGFSNYHGLLTRSSNNNYSNASAAASPPLLSDAPTTQFTSTPCVGMFVRAAGAFPAEVEQLDRLLCGELVYCTPAQLRYHASSHLSAGRNYFVDLTVDILNDLTLPRGLADAGGGGLRPLPSVRSLTFRCRDGSALLGGLPAGLAALMPFLQELRVQGCRAAGPLPPQLAALRYLRVLDLSANDLSGSLPAEWGNMALGYLNLSYNALTGPLPTSWRGIITPQAAAAPPPSLSPPLAAGRRRRAQATTAAAVDMLVADISVNKLEGPVDRGYVYDSCVKRELRMQLRGEPSANLAGGFGTPTFLLQYNPGIAAWAGRYALADLGSDSGRSNLCGAVGYKIALGVLWGVFGACLLAIGAWSAISAWRAAREARRGRFFIADVGGPSPAEDASAAAAAASCSPASCTAGCASLAGRAAAAAAALWRRRWVRRVTLLLRIGYLVADVALDIRVIVWLFNDGDRTSAGVCLAFLLAAQAAVSAALVASLAHHFFTSGLLVAALSPLLLALGPVAGPVLAVANIRNSDVPLVFWRYLELVEFCVALLQAPAESVTQSVMYDRLNRLGNGMYMDHGLFLASIILSLGDMLIAALKLFRYKRGPFRRILVALTHLDRVRDPVDYRKPLLSSSLDGSRPPDGREADDYVPHPLETPLNPPPGAAGRRSPDTSRSQMVALREGAGPLPVSPPGGGGAATAGDAAATPVLELSPREGREAGSPPVDDGRASAASAASSSAGVAAAAATAAHTFTPLTAPRYRPSLLAASSQRLGGGSSYTVGTPSRLGPGGAARGGALSTSAHPPLRPSTANLPATPTKAGSGGSEPSSSAQARALAAAEAEAAAGPLGDDAGEGEDGLGRRLRGVQGAMPLGPLTSQAGSISSGVYGSAATGGHGPPEAQDMLRTASGTGRGHDHDDGGAFARASEPPPRPSGAAAASTLPPPSPPADPRLFSAAAAVQAALAGAGGGPLSTRRAGPAGDDALRPKRLVLGPPATVSASGQAPEAGGASGSPLPSARALRHVVSEMAASSRSGQSSPARRREGPALSIAVPASPVQAQAIEVIRISTPSSSRHLSPQTSRGAPTPVGMLPPPPPQQLQHMLQQERLGRQQQQQQQQQERQQAKPGRSDPPPPAVPPDG